MQRKHTYHRQFTDLGDAQQKLIAQGYTQPVADYGIWVQNMTGDGGGVEYAQIESHSNCYFIRHWYVPEGDGQ
jgi:hypothetical protein